MYTQNDTPTLQVVLDEPFGKFGYNKQIKCLFHLWNGFLSLEEVKRVAEITNIYVEQLGLTNIIADHRSMELFSEEVSAYISNVWLPKLESLGVKTTFVVMSGEAFTQLTAVETHENARNKSGIDIRHFGKMSDAIESVKVYNLQQVLQRCVI
jgi:hypothetical protein